MSLTDPFAITISGAASSLPKVESSGKKSVYSNADGTIVVTASHQNTSGARTRTMLRIDTKKVTADPFKPSENVQVGAAFYVVVDQPPAGYTDAEMKAIIDGFISAMNASSGAMITKLLAGEH